jgi:GNAT superfamily N-acetyltransferase
VAEYLLEIQAKIEIRSVDSLSDYERWQIRSWQSQVFDLESEQFSAVDWYILVSHDDHWVSMLEIVERVATVGGQPVNLGGIGSVTTLPAWRGHGFSSAALRTAATFMREELGVHFGLLLCMETVVPFYERLGWRVVEAPLVYDQPSGKLTSDQVTMILPCGESEWPKGPIDLCGLPW